MGITFRSLDVLWPGELLRGPDLWAHLQGMCPCFWLPVLSLSLVFLKRELVYRLIFQKLDSLCWASRCSLILANGLNVPKTIVMVGAQNSCPVSTELSHVLSLWKDMFILMKVECLFHCPLGIRRGNSFIIFPTHPHPHHPTLTTSWGFVHMSNHAFLGERSKTNRNLGKFPLLWLPVASKGMEVI